MAWGAYNLLITAARVGAVNSQGPRHRHQPVCSGGVSSPRSVALTAGRTEYLVARSSLVERPRAGSSSAKQGFHLRSSIGFPAGQAQQASRRSASTTWPRSCYESGTLLFFCYAETQGWGSCFGKYLDDLSRGTSCRTRMRLTCRAP